MRSPLKIRPRQVSLWCPQHTNATCFIILPCRMTVPHTLVCQRNPTLAREPAFVCIPHEQARHCIGLDYLLCM